MADEKTINLKLDELKNQINMFEVDEGMLSNNLKEKVDKTGLIEERSLSEDEKGQIQKNIGIEKTILFAENERQKSKNLFRVGNFAGYKKTKNGVTAVINSDYTITLNGTCTSDTWWDLFGGIDKGSNFVEYEEIKLDAQKKYTLSAKVISGSYSIGETTEYFRVSLKETNGTNPVSGTESAFYIKPNEEMGYNVKSGVSKYNSGWFLTKKTSVFDNFTFGIMLVEGEDNEYQNFNGEIVHKNGTLSMPNMTDTNAYCEKGVAHIVETYLSSDKNTWYRIWSDGWKECGGYITNNGSGSMTIRLPVEFTSSNYILNITNQRTSASTTNTAIRELGWVSKTTSSFTKYLSTNKNYDVGFDYYACGY